MTIREDYFRTLCYTVSVLHNINHHRELWCDILGSSPTTLEEDQELLVDFSSILCLWFAIQDMRTYNFFDWVSYTGKHSGENLRVVLIKTHTSDDKLICELPI